MTSYAYKRTFNMGEIIVIKESLKLIIEKCDAVLKDAKMIPIKIAPYLVYKMEAQSLLNRLDDNKIQTRTSFV